MSESVPPGTPPPSPPPDDNRRPGGPTHPPTRADDLLDLADSLGITTPVRQEARRAVAAVPMSPGGPAQISGQDGRVASPSGTWPDGRAVGADGAATFTNPDTRVPLRFDAGEHRLVGAVEVNVCGGLDIDQVSPAHCGSSAPHRWHDLLNP